MEADTIQLLKKCDAGCKMAINSMDQVKEYAEKEKLRKVLDTYEGKHKKLKDEIYTLLKQYGEDGQEPDKMASAFSWISTEMKLMLKDNSNQIAKIMMDGCNMGIQGISEEISKFPAASRESVNLAKDLVKTEEAFMKEMKEFL